MTDHRSNIPPSGRSAVIARDGMVATSHPLAVQAGLDVLRQGGNAVDAAITANAVLGVVEPMSCGIGGDLFVIYWDAATQTLHGLNGSGRSPYNLSCDIVTGQGLTQIPEKSILTWSVPGCVHGWEQLRARFGTRPLSALMHPAIAYAAGGFPVSPMIAKQWHKAAAGLSKWPASATTYLPDGRPPRVGEVIRNPNLAHSYRLIAEQGIGAFYEGPIAEAIVAFSKTHGGYFSMKDFEHHTSDWVEPVSTSFRGVELFELPPNGQGISVLQMLNLLEAYDLAEMGFGSVEYMHRLIETKKLAYADRARFYADPAFETLPIDTLISKAYAEERRKLIDPNRALQNVPHGDPILEHGDTVYITVVDKDRNCCSFIQSVSVGFGSDIVPGDVGFAMQNRGAMFALTEGHPNRLEPHKRPFNTIIPALAMRDGVPWLCFGVMGGAMQPQGQVQVLVNMLEFGMDVQEAGDAPRVYHRGSATPTDLPGEAGGGTASLERGFSKELVEGLRRKGHRIQPEGWGFGGYQGIMLDHTHGTLHGGTERRNDGCAMGY